MNNTRYILIGNYIPDKQESMTRFAKMLADTFESKSICSELWYPTVLFGNIKVLRFSTLGKYIAYIDKYIAFPIVLLFKHLWFWIKRENVYYHICDHSNAPYLAFLPKKKTSITCHDVLAIRAALGYQDTYCEVGSMGVWLQKIILNYLSKAEKVICVSYFTYNQLIEISHSTRKRKWIVVHNAFNASFSAQKNEYDSEILTKYGLGTPYLFHLGSNLPRKNRMLLLYTLVQLGKQWTGKVCFAGHKLDKEQLEYIYTHNLQERVIVIENPENVILQVLYRNCYAFVFPSYSEGFGWPIIEAQACGVPVIVSALEPFYEVSGIGGALFANPHEPGEFANKVLDLADIDLRKTLIRNGYNNIKRFDIELLVSKYLNFINDVS